MIRERTYPSISERSGIRNQRCTKFPNTPYEAMSTPYTMKIDDTFLMIAPYENMCVWPAATATKMVSAITPDHATRMAFIGDSDSGRSIWLIRNFRTIAFNKNQITRAIATNPAITKLPPYPNRRYAGTTNKNASHVTASHSPLLSRNCDRLNTNIYHRTDHMIRLRPVFW